MSDQPLWERYRAQIEAFEAAKINFDLTRRHEYTAANGWNIDQYEADLPAEAPGPPAPNGSWQAACKVLREYKFPDPTLITGIFYPDRPIERRVMLLQARFLGFTFYFGVRVGGVVDEVRDGPHGREQVWGYNYHTLEGHFERGQIQFEIIKRLESGAVIFHIEAFSQTATIRNPFYRIGFRIFGRPLQRRFARVSIERMQRMVREQLALGATPSAADAPAVQPASADQGATEKLREINNDQN